MALNEILLERLEGIRHVLLAQARAGRPMASASKGNERELFVRHFLAQVFPPHFRFGEGDITDSTGAKSGQVDVIVELPFFPSFPVPPAEVRLYMAEGVAAAIEVKSDLSAQWREIEVTTAGVKTLHPERIRTMWIGENPPDKIPVLAVGYTGYKSLDGLVTRFSSTGEQRRPDCLLVLDDPGLFVSSDTQSEGLEALFLFIARLNWLCTKLITAGFAVRNYVDHTS